MVMNLMETEMKEALSDSRMKVDGDLEDTGIAICRE